MKLQIVFALATLACVALCKAYPEPEPEPLLSRKEISAYVNEFFKDYKDLKPKQIIEKLSKDAAKIPPFGNTIKATIEQYKNLSPLKIMDKIKQLPPLQQAFRTIKGLEKELDAFFNIKH